MVFDVSLVLFWIFIAVISATYILYPVALLVLSQFLRNEATIKTGAPAQMEKVSIIICAHNEAAVIEEKLLSIAAQDWPGMYEVILANDGSTDGTSELAGALSPRLQNLQILDFDRKGKWFVLNQAVKQASGTILVFTDADTIWAKDALSQLLAPLSDETVGCVAGNIISRKSQRTSAAGFDRLFRAYESAIRKSEEHLAGCVSADGGLFAIRTSLFDPIPPGVTDDFYISTGAVLKGTRMAFQADAIAYENAISGGKKNFRRRIRITVRGLTSLFRRRPLLNPFRFGFYSVAMFFHKFLRRLAAVFIVALFPLSLILSTQHVVFAVLSAGQAIVYGSMIASLVTGKPLPGLGKFSMAALHILGLAVGFVLFVSGKRFDRWAPSRSSSA